MFFRQRIEYCIFKNQQITVFWILCRTERKTLYRFGRSTQVGKEKGDKINMEQIIYIKITILGERSVFMREDSTN